MPRRKSSEHGDLFGGAGAHPSAPAPVPVAAPEPIAQHTHCAHCQARLKLLEGTWSDHKNGWLCMKCQGGE